ncbi:hypothetical protein, partial [Streptomyces sp. NPDC002156]
LVLKRRTGWGCGPALGGRGRVGGKVALNGLVLKRRTGWRGSRKGVFVVLGGPGRMGLSVVDRTG